jgi:hypothetical protein
MLIDDIRKRELGIFEIFAMARGVYKANISAIIRVAVFIGFPINILLSFVAVSVSELGSSFDFQAITSDPSALEKFIASPEWRKMGLYYIVIVMIQSMMMPLITMAVARITKNYATGADVDSRGAMLEAFSKGAVLIAAAFISEMVIGGGLILFIIPGLIFMVNLYFYVYAIVLDDKGILSSLSYSISLVKGYFLKTVIAAAIIYGVNYSVSYLLSNLLMWGEIDLMTEVMARFIITVVDSYFAVSVTIFYLNRQAVKEGAASKIEDLM